MDKLGIFSKYYNYIIWTIYFLYFVAFIGVISINYNYLREFSVIVQILIALYLIIRFHPFKQSIVFLETDSNIIYASGILILVNLGLVELLLRFYDDIRLYFFPNLPTIQLPIHQTYNRTNNKIKNSQ